MDKLKEIYDEIFMLKRQNLPTTIFNSLLYIDCQEMLNHYTFLTPTPANLKFIDTIIDAVPTVSVINECDIENRDKNILILKHFKKHLKENTEPNFDQYLDDLKKSTVIIKRNSGIDDYTFASKIFSQWSKTRNASMRKIKLTDTTHNVTNGFVKFANKNKLFDVQQNIEILAINAKDEGFTVDMFVNYQVGDLQQFIELNREKLISFTQNKKEEAIYTCHSIFNYSGKAKTIGFRRGYGNYGNSALFTTKKLKTDYKIQTNLTKASICINTFDVTKKRKDTLGFRIEISNIDSNVIKELIFKSFIDKNNVEKKAIINE